MLKPSDYIEQILDWAKKGRFDYIKASAKKRLDAKEYIKLPLGSYWSEIHREWFERAKRMKLVVENTYGQWIPYIQFDEVNEEIGKRGMTTVYDTRHTKTIMRRSDLDALTSFNREYEEWKHQQHQMEMNVTDIVDSFHSAL